MNARFQASPTLSEVEDQRHCDHEVEHSRDRQARSEEPLAISLAYRRALRGNATYRKIFAEFMPCFSTGPKGR